MDLYKLAGYFESATTYMTLSEAIYDALEDLQNEFPRERSLSLSSVVHKAENIWFALNGETTQRISRQDFVQGVMMYVERHSHRMYLAGDRLPDMRINMRTGVSSWVG